MNFEMMGPHARARLCLRNGYRHLVGWSALCSGTINTRHLVGVSRVCRHGEIHIAVVADELKT